MTISPLDVGSGAGFGAFYNTYYEKFVRYAFYYVNNRQTAEDITHDAILYYWENKQCLPVSTDVLGYILVTVRNKCLNYLKHLQVEYEHAKQFAELYEWEVKVRIATLEEPHYADIFTSEMQSILTASLEKLPKQTQYIFVQNRFKHRPRKEIAAEMKVSIQKIDYHINKATDHLYKDLKDYLPLLVYFFSKICN